MKGFMQSRRKILGCSSVTSFLNFENAGKSGESGMASGQRDKEVILLSLLPLPDLLSHGIANGNVLLDGRFDVIAAAKSCCCCALMDFQLNAVFRIIMMIERMGFMWRSSYIRSQIGGRRMVHIPVYWL